MHGSAGRGLAPKFRFRAQPLEAPSKALSRGKMSTHRSPDRPASFLHRLVGIEDGSEPPITDDEYDLYRRFVDHLEYAPPDIAARYRYPANVDRRTRSAVRSFVSDPGLPRVVEMLELAKAQAVAEAQRREQEKQAEEAKAELRRQQEKLAAIETFHNNQLSELEFRVGQFKHLIGQTSIEEAALRVANDSQSDYARHSRDAKLKTATQRHRTNVDRLVGAVASIDTVLGDKKAAEKAASGMAMFTIRRSLVSMTEQERAALRMADVLAATGQLGPDDHLRIAVPIVWNGGECAYDFDQGLEFRERSATLEILKQLVAASLGTSAGAREFLIQAVRTALDQTRGLAQSQREIIERYLFSGNRWMSEAEGQRALARGDLSASALRIGGFPGGSGELFYDLRESLITIAPSGSGKSQAHVLRNLLYMEAPAVVLDIKGEMSAASLLWRGSQGRKTYVFSPREPETSFHYNPLDDISTDPAQAWEDARTVADLMFKPTAKSRDDAYFEGRARDFLTTALLDVALSQTGAKRTMSTVLELLYTSDDEDVLAWCNRLETRNSTQLKLQASALRGMPVKQRESLLDTARRHVEIWQSPSVLKVTGDTTFDGASLRADNATVYLKVTLEDVERYASVLRVLVGQLLLKLYRVQPESDAPVVTFFLDELPRLGRLDVIEQSLDMGRGYGVRLWLFCQNLGQLQTAYPNAQGMMSNCAIRCFMNPDEDAARWLAENLGTRHGLLDGTRKPLVEPHQLTGPEFANQVIVFSRGQLPARLDKKPAYADPVCINHMAKTPAPSASQTSATPPASTGGASSSGVSPTASATPPDWDAVRSAMPVATPPNPQTVTRSTFSFWRAVGGVLVAVVAIAAFIARLASNNEITALRTEKATLAASLEAASLGKQSLEREKSSWIESVRISETARSRVQEEADTAKRALESERKDRAYTQERLASLQRTLESAQRDLANARRELEAEKARGAARESSLSAPAQQVSPEPPAAFPQRQFVPIEVTTPRPQTTQTPSSGAFPDSTKFSLPSETLRNVVAQPPVPVTDCDILAANPNDPRRAGVGVKFPELKRNAAAAVEACERALAANPKEQRFLYQKARALYAAGDMGARAIFDQLLSVGYPSAFDNAAQYLLREGNNRDAEVLLRRGVELEDPDAMVSLADGIRAGRLALHSPGEDIMLYGRAAKLGHQGARNTVEQWQSLNNVVNETANQVRRAIER